MVEAVGCLPGFLSCITFKFLMQHDLILAQDVKVKKVLKVVPINPEGRMGFNPL